MAGGEGPNMEPVSPRHRSTYRWPSTQATRAPRPSVTKIGYGPAHRTIQFIGTPARRDFLPRSNRFRDLGWRSSKVFSSRAMSDVTRPRSTVRTVFVSRPFDRPRAPSPDAGGGV